MGHPVYITHKNQLIEHLEQGSKPAASWRIGTENEQLIFQNKTLQRAPYEGPSGIAKVLESFENNGWQPIYDRNKIIAVKKNQASITLEPAGQFELSGAPLKNIHECAEELNSYHTELYGYLQDLDLSLFSQGMDPKTAREHMPWMPKQRYDIMKRYMPTRGNHGLDMMTATTTVQTNLDYGSEADLGLKFKVSMALQPIITGMFANSPLRHGQLNGFKSYRAHIWQDTDPDRCGLLPFAFEDHFSFEKYVDYILDVPMYFVYRDGVYMDHAGHSFRDFMQGNLPGMEGQLPLMQDFTDHMTTAFPEVRIKQYIEMRGADSGPEEHISALSALWTGLLYDADTLMETYAWIKEWSHDECKQLLLRTAQHGTQTIFQENPLHVFIQKILELATQGLNRRNILNANNQDESIYLDYLKELNKNNQCPADRSIDIFRQTSTPHIDKYLMHFLHTA